ncbi:MAG: hypothetical protein PW735_08700 [Acidobacteriaceae bacterium]|nr:hypothetical protein [Acidobacteriaceae bacterium]
MSEFRLSFPANLIAGKSRLSAEDVSILRKVSFPHGIRSSDDAVLLLAIHNSCPEKCDEWAAFFIESLTDFIVHHTYPQGSLDDVNAAWLIRMLSRGGVIHSEIEFEVLLSVISASDSLSPMLAAFALDQLRHALADDIGAYRHYRALHRQGVTLHDLDFVHHVLRSAMTGGEITLSAVEMAALDRIDRAAQPGANHPGWAEFRAAAKLRHDETSRRARWLRVSDDMFADAAAAA